jgi:hypothetical protein
MSSSFNPNNYYLQRKGNFKNLGNIQFIKETTTFGEALFCQESRDSKYLRNNLFVGRNNDNDFRFNKMCCARYQWQMYLKDGKLFIVDLNVRKKNFDRNLIIIYFPLDEIRNFPK